MSIESIDDKQTFKTSVIDADPSQLIVVVFTDGASEESNILVSMVEKATQKASDVKFYQVDITKVAAAAEKLGTTKAPVTVLYKGGEKKKTMEGNYGGPQLKEAIEQNK